MSARSSSADEIAKANFFFLARGSSYVLEVVKFDSVKSKDFICSVMVRFDSHL